MPVNFVSRYNPVNDSWAIETSLTRDLFRFSGCTYVNSTFEAIYLFGGQSFFDSLTQSYHIQNSTLLYVPLSIAIANYGRQVHHLSGGEIAGVVIGVTVGVILGFFVIGSFLGGYCYYKYYYVKLEDMPESSSEAKV